MNFRNYNFTSKHYPESMERTETIITSIETEIEQIVPEESSLK